MANENKERAILVITSVGSKREPTSGNPVVTFGAKKSGDDTGAGYETWGNDLVDLIVKDAHLDCEVTFVQKGEQGINRVTQIFDEKGNPIRQVRRRSTDSRQYGKSDYQVMLERISIEGQAAYNGIIELLKSKIIDLEHNQAKVSLEYAEMKMMESMKPVLKSSDESTDVRSPSNTIDKKGKKPTKPAEVSQPTTEAPISTEMLQELKQIASEKGYTTDLVKPLVLAFGVQQAKELTETQGQKLMGKLKKGEGLVQQTHLPVQ